MKLTPASLAMFEEFATDVPDWNGSPPNYHEDKASRGNVSDLVKKGLIRADYDEEDGFSWIYFTEAGIELAESMGYDMSEARR